MLNLSYLVFSCVLCALILGCDPAPRRVDLPPLSAATAGANAITEFDADKDGALDASELARCPSLRDGVKSIDKDGDGRVTAEEISDRIAGMQATKIAIISFACQVLSGGQPLAGAKVTLQPENFVTPALQPASGTTDENGYATVRIEGQTGVHCGYFRAQISKIDEAGRETIPDRFNANTVLGIEVAPDTLKTPIFIVGSY